MYVRAGRPAFARPCVGIHKSTYLMSSSLLLQQCPACLVRLGALGSLLISVASFYFIYIYIYIYVYIYAKIIDLEIHIYIYIYIITGFADYKLKIL